VGENRGVRICDAPVELFKIMKLARAEKKPNGVTCALG